MSSSTTATKAASVTTATAALTLASIVFASGCAYGRGTGGDYSVGGTITGVTAQGLLLTDSGGAAVFVSSDGKFVMENSFLDGASYDLKVDTESSNTAATCSVTNGAGTIEGASIDNVSIICSPSAFTVSGNVTGLSDIGLVLTSRGESIALAKDGSFTFFTPVTTGSSYAVEIAQQPAGATCSVTGGTGTIGASAVSDVVVTCLAKVASNSDS